MDYETVAMNAFKKVFLSREFSVLFGKEMKEAMEKETEDCSVLIENIQKYKEKIKTFVDKAGDSCLIYAIRQNLIITQELIDNSNLDLQDENGDTALIL